SFPLRTFAREGRMTVTIGRRELLGAAAAWPFAARAQQRGETPRVGYIRAGTPHNDPFREEFMRGMRDLRYVGRRNILVHRDDPDQEDAVEGSSSARRGDRVNRRGVHHAAWRAAPACLSRLAS